MSPRSGRQVSSIAPAILPIFEEFPISRAAHRRSSAAQWTGGMPTWVNHRMAPAEGIS